MVFTEARVLERSNGSHDLRSAPREERLDFCVFINRILARVEKIAPFHGQRRHPVRKPAIALERETDGLLDVPRRGDGLDGYAVGQGLTRTARTCVPPRRVCPAPR